MSARACAHSGAYSCGSLVNAGSCNGDGRIDGCDCATYCGWVKGFDLGIGLCVSGDGDELGMLKLSLNIDSRGTVGVSFREDAVFGRS